MGSYKYIIPQFKKIHPRISEGWIEWHPAKPGHKYMLPLCGGSYQGPVLIGKVTDNVDADVFKSFTDKSASMYSLLLDHVRKYSSVVFV